MRRNLFVLLVACLCALATAFAAKKPRTTAKAEARPVAKVALMTSEQKALHALNRLTFGARTGDLEQVKQIGADQWIEQQLNPDSIPENPVLTGKLEPLDSLRMSTVEMLRKYPSPQMIKAMAEGRMALPEDKQARAAAQVAIGRYERRKGQNAAGQAPVAGQATVGDGQSMAKAMPVPGRAGVENGRVTMETIAALPLTAGQKREFVAGTQESRLALLESLPDEQLSAVLDALPQQLRNRLGNAGSASLKRRVEVLNNPMQIVGQDLTEGKLLRAIYSNRQLDEVLVDFWYNHFNVFLDKGADRELVTSYERDVIRPHVLGKFKDLLLATAQSPAMLFYLDNWESAGADSPGPVRPVGAGAKKQGLNENYGRELMELHTLGVDGGYTQQDVTEVARCFTGWTIRQPRMGGGFFFNPRMHDRGEKHVLGVTIPAGGGMNDGLKVLDILAKSPATARFISRSLAIRFVSDNPPDSLIEKMAATFTSTDGDLREVMRTMLRADEFWATENFRAKLKSPLEMVASAVRAVNGEVDSALQMAAQLNSLGEPLYRKAEPTGYTNRGGDWLNSASLLARMNFANSLAQGKVTGVKVDASQFGGDASQIERSILLTDVSPVSRDAIQAGLDGAPAVAGVGQAQMIAGLTLGSPDFQRR